MSTSLLYVLLESFTNCIFNDCYCYAYSQNDLTLVDINALTRFCSDIYVKSKCKVYRSILKVIRICQ